MACPSTNWKCLVLETMLTKWHLPGIASLLRNSPSLDTLTLYVYPGESPFPIVGLSNPSSFGLMIYMICLFELHLADNCILVNLQDYDDMWLRSCEIDEENFWNSQEQSFHCLTNHLKTIRIHGYITVSRVIQLVQFLLKSAMVLEKMVISPSRNVDPQFLEKLAKFPRASTRAVILFS